ncbi:MAG: hypothetical protein ABI162_17755 [Luteolibacter sp.]
MREIDDVARVMATHGALFDLWLQSGEYEEWAKQRLIDPKGQVNVDGMAIARKLSVKWPCYYLWFYDTEDGAPERCPSCGEFLDKSVLWATGKCYRCCVLM